MRQMYPALVLLSVAVMAGGADLVDDAEVLVVRFE